MIYSVEFLQNYQVIKPSIDFEVVLLFQNFLEASHYSYLEQGILNRNTLLHGIL